MSALRASVLPPIQLSRGTPTLGGEHAYGLGRALAERQRASSPRALRQRRRDALIRRLHRARILRRLLLLSLITLPLLVAAIIEWWLQHYPGLFGH